MSLSFDDDISPCSLFLASGRQVSLAFEGDTMEKRSKDAALCDITHWVSVTSGRQLGAALDPSLGRLLVFGDGGTLLFLVRVRGPSPAWALGGG